MAEHTEQLVDELLVMDAQSGQVRALEKLVSRWQRRLWWHAYNLTGSSDGAWDITQETWLGIVRGLGRLHDPARFRAWAYRIATNKSNDWLRRNVHVPIPEPGSDAPQQTNEQQSGETARDVREMIRRLPRQSRAVLTLYYLEQLSVPEISVALNIPNGTVKSRLHAARTEFKALWQSLEQAHPPAHEKGEPR